MDHLPHLTIEFTGFTAASTAEEVVRGIDLKGKTIIITGGHSGLGLESTRVLAKIGASVTVAARDTERAARAVAGIAGVEVGRLDLVDPTSIDVFAKHRLASNRPLHVLINNASACPPRCRPRRPRATHAATSFSFGQIRWDDPNFATGYTPMDAYMQTKKANVLFAVELDRRWSSDGIRGYALHPGVVVGPTPRSSPGYASLRAQGLIDEAGTPIINPAFGHEDDPARREYHRVRSHQPEARESRRRVLEGQRRLTLGRRAEAAHPRQPPCGGRFELRGSRIGEAAMGAERAAAGGHELERAMSARSSSTRNSGCNRDRRQRGATQDVTLESPLDLRLLDSSSP